MTTSTDYEVSNPKSSPASIGAVYGISPISRSALATPTVAVNTTSSPIDPAVPCNGACVGGIIFAALVICIVLLLSLGFTCRSHDRWSRNYSQRRTNSLVVVTVTSLSPNRSQVSSSHELPAIPPHLEDILPPSYDNVRDLPSDNVTDDQLSTVTLTNSSLELALTSVTSLNSIGSGELSIPPAPVISTIPLPPIDEYSYHPQYNTIPFNYENHIGIHPWSAPVDAQSHENEDDSLNSNTEPTGSLGLILG